jgi:chromate transport protein ChrA
MKTLPTPADNLDGVPPQGSEHPTFREAFRFWLKLGFISFGGPTGQIAVMHAELVEKKKWISEARFLHALNYCMLLPGPEAQQLATYVGALVTFGGAYAVLPYVAQQAVQTHHWLSAGQMVDGLGLAETTPGPLILVTQFVGFLGGWNHPGQLPPLLAATIGALITTWTTFTPCFLWSFWVALTLKNCEVMKR